MTAYTENWRVDVGTTEVTIRRVGSSRTMTARILGQTTDADGRTIRLVLDRRIHGQGSTFEGWSAQGAVVTIFERNDTDYRTRN
jgi:hypothetical protein